MHTSHRTQSGERLPLTAACCMGRRPRVRCGSAIVGTMKRFDESLLLAHDMVGLPILLYKRNRPNQKGGYRCVVAPGVSSPRGPVTTSSDLRPLALLPLPPPRLEAAPHAVPGRHHFAAAIVLSPQRHKQGRVPRYGIVPPGGAACRVARPQNVRSVRDAFRGQAR